MNIKDGEMAHKTYKTRFPLRKLNRKADFKKKSMRQIPRPRAAGRGAKGISRRKTG